jgi:AraC-like DNA-binding protein
MVDDAPSLVVHTTFRTTDTGEAEDFLRAAYAENTLAVTGVRDDFLFDHVMTTAPGLRSNTLTLGVDFTADTLTRPDDPITVVEPVRGRLAYLDSDYPDAYGDTGAVVLAAPDGPVHVLCEGREVALVQLRWSDVASYAAATTGLRPDQLVFDALTPTTAGAGRYWRNTAAHVRKHVLAAPWAGTSPIVLDQAFRSLAAALLSTFPNTALAHSTGPECPPVRGEVSDETLRQVIEFLESEADQPIGPRDISELAGMPAREVVEGLRRRRDTHPSRLLWAARLRGVRRDLLDADPGSTHLTALTARWGFTHLGRLRAAYLRQFDETPEQTLRR